MSKIGDINNYHDLAGLQQLKAKASQHPESKEALKKAAQHFESIFIGMMLKSMRQANAVFEKDNPMNSNTTQFFRDMYDQQLSTDMASNGSLGLADLIVQQLSNDGDGFTSASVLRNDAGLTRQNYSSQPVAVEKVEQDKNSKTNPLSAEAPWLNPLNKPEPSADGSIVTSFNQVVTNTFTEVGAKSVAPDANLEITSNSKPVKQQVNFDSPDDFISGMWDYAKKAATKIGLNPAVMIAQSALETGWGKHIIKDKNGDSSFNLFNVKAHRDWDGDKAAQSTLEFEEGIPVRKTEPFRVYNNFSEAFDDFVNFLKSNRRYEDALEKTKNSEQFLQGLQEAGYATDPNYADKILRILNSDKFKNVIGQLQQNADNNIGV